MGGHGTGGEYDVQLGFGWTNGVIMDLLNMYGDKLSPVEDEFEPSSFMSPDHEQEHHPNHNQIHNQIHNQEAISAAAAAPNSLIVPLIITAVIFISIFVGGSIW